MPLCNMMRSQGKENEDINQQSCVAHNAGPIDGFEQHVDRTIGPAQQPQRPALENVGAREALIVQEASAFQSLDGSVVVQKRIFVCIYPNRTLRRPQSINNGMFSVSERSRLIIVMCNPRERRFRSSGMNGGESITGLRV